MIFLLLLVHWWPLQQSPKHSWRRFDFVAMNLVLKLQTIEEHYFHSHFWWFPVCCLSHGQLLLREWPHSLLLAIVLLTQNFHRRCNGFSPNWWNQTSCCFQVLTLDSVALQVDPTEEELSHQGSGIKLRQNGLKVTHSFSSITSSFRN